MNDLSNPRRVMRLLILMLCINLVCVGSSSAELSEDERKYDPDIESQTDKTGAYRIEIGALPTRLYMHAANENGWMKNPAEAVKLVREKPWMTPSKNFGKTYSFEVVTPKDYRRSVPAGVVAFINSGDSGKLYKSVQKVLGEKNIIVIGANKAGNKVDAALRQALAYHAVELLARRYAIDQERVYITGNSGGGRAACRAIYVWPETFKGGFPMVGITSLKPIAVPGKAGAYWSGIEKMPSRDALKQMAMNNRYVFVTAEKDFNRVECEAGAKQLQEMGFKQAKAVVIPKLGHGLGAITEEQFRPIIEFLDAPLIKGSLELFEDAEKDLKRDRLEDALAGYEKALPKLKLSQDKEIVAMATKAAAQIDALNQKYNKAMAALEKAITDQDVQAATAALRELQRSWRDKLGRDAANEYRKKISEIRRQ